MIIYHYCFPSFSDYHITVSMAFFQSHTKLSTGAPHRKRLIRNNVCTSFAYQPLKPVLPVLLSSELKRRLLLFQMQHHPVVILDAVFGGTEGAVFLLCRVEAAPAVRTGIGRVRLLSSEPHNVGIEDFLFVTVRGLVFRFLFRPIPADHQAYGSLEA